MVRRWFVFSALALASAANLRSPSIWGAEPVAQPSALAEGATASALPPISDEDFLALPARDLAPGSAISIRVGDAVDLKLDNRDGVVRVELGPEPAKKKVAPDEPQAEAPGDDGGGPLSWALASDSLTPQGAVRVVAIKPGKATLPSLLLRDKDGKPIARTNPWQSEIVSSIDPKDQKAQEPVELRPPVGLPFPIWVAVLGGVIAVGLIAAVVYLLMRWSRRKRPAPVVAPYVDPRSEDEIALDELLAIEKAAHWKQARFKQHYFSVSEVLKRYLGARYRFDAPEMTTREIVTQMEERQLPSRVIDAVETLFVRMDRVKFTDFLPEADEPTAILADGRSIVESTRRPKPVVAPNPDQQSEPKP